MKNLETIAKEGSIKTIEKQEKYSNSLKQNLKDFFSKPANYLSQKAGSILKSIMLPYL